MISMDEILKKLKSKAKPDQLEGMARYGIETQNRLEIQFPICEN